MARARNQPGRVIRAGLARLIGRRDDVVEYGRSRSTDGPRAPSRTSPRWIVVAVLVLLAVLAARATAAPNLVPPVVIVPDDTDECDGDGCDDGTPSELEVVPRVVRRRAADPCAAGSPCATPCSPCAMPIRVSAVAAAGVRAAGLADDPAPSWRYRTRLAGLVPQLSVRVGRNLTWKEVDDPTLGYTNMWDVRASWHLERLLFDPNEIRIAAIDVSRRRERRRVEMLVIHTYYQWLAAPSERPELTADLDAMTAGWFSQELAKGQKP
ncbi:MAG TPA: hypothetical protein VF403_28075 [Kofleriaceae bacterium]